MRPGRPARAVRPAAPSGCLARAAQARARLPGWPSGSGSGSGDASGSGARCGGQGSPASMAAWCWRAMARSTAWRSASNSRHHPAVVCGSSSGWACGSSSGWACPRRWSSALALPAASLMSRVPADHVSYRALPASSRCRSAASCRGEGLGAGRAGFVMLDFGVCGLPSGVGFGLRGEPQGPAHVRRGAGLGAFPGEDSWLPAHRGAGRAVMAASSRISSAVNTALRMFSSSGLPRCGSR